MPYALIGPDNRLCDYRVTAMPRKRTATGYGRDLPTQYMVFYGKRWRRVLYACYGNAASVYIKDKEGKWLIVDI